MTNRESDRTVQKQMGWDFHRTNFTDETDEIVFSYDSNDSYALTLFFFLLTEKLCKIPTLHL